VGVGQRENWEESESQFADLADAPAKLNPVVTLIMSLFAPSTVTDDRILHTLRTKANDIQYLKLPDLDQAWTILYEVSIGSRHMRDYGLKDLGVQHDSEDYSLRPHISKAVAAFDEYGGLKMSREEYSFLSEFAHPSVGAFSGYREIDEQTWSFVFPEPAPILKSDPRLGSVLIRQ